jgi:hypothetical protein
MNDRSDVGRDHVRGDREQQHVGEAAGGRARVEGVAPGHGQVREGGERSGQLVTATGDVPGVLVGLGDADRRVAGDLGGGLGGGFAVHRDPARRDQAGRLLAGAGQAAPDEFGVEPRARALARCPSGHGVPCEPGPYGAADEPGAAGVSWAGVPEPSSPRTSRSRS